MTIPLWLDDFLFAYGTLILSIGTNGLLALSMYAVLSLGMLSLGSAAFMGLGAYTGALLTVKLGLPFVLVLAAAAAVPALLALAIGLPTLRLTGVYLAIATIGLGEVLRVGYVNWDYAGGALGLSGIPERAGFGIVFGLLAAALLGFWLVGRSKLGRSFEAIRVDEDAARVMGIDVTAHKLAALIVSAALAGIAGALNAHFSSFIGPNDYAFDAAVSILSYAILGGIGTPFGPVLGALLLTALPELLRFLHDLRGVFNGLIIVLVVIFLPRGLLALRMRRTA